MAGSSGMVGSAIRAHFEACGFEMVPHSPSRVDFLKQTETIEFLSDVKPDLVVNAAAKVGGIGANSSQPVEFLIENLTIQNNIISAAHIANVGKFIFLGSSCIYPRDCPQPIKEEYLLTGPLEGSNSAYAIAKIAGIELINSYRRQHGRAWISLMPTNLYGPRDNFSLADSHVLPALIRKFTEAIESESRVVHLWGNGSARREFLHVNDLADAVLIASEKYNNDLHLNIGSGLDLTIKELAYKVSASVGFTGEIHWDTSRPNGTPQKVLDVSRIKALGWEPKISIEEGISSTVAWYQDANARGLVRK